MKNKIISLIAIIATLAVMIFATVKVSNNVTEVGVQKAKGDETIQTGNQTEGDETEEEQTYSFSMILNQIDKTDKVKMGGNKVSITSENPNVTFEVYDAVTGSEITADQISEVTVYELPENGAQLKISGIKEGERNSLVIENKELVENYAETFKRLTIEVDSSNIDSIRVAIKNITKLVNGEEVTTEGSEDEIAAFIYQEEDGTVKINNNADLKIYYAFVANSDIPEGQIGLTDAQMENLEWNEYNKETGYKAEKNGIVYSKSKYKDGAYSNINNYIVNNVDKIAPEINLNDIIYDTNEYTAKISGTVNDGDATKDYGKSGLKGYAFTTENVEPNEYIYFEDYKEVEDTEDIELTDIVRDGTYYVWVIDNAGNKNSESVEVTIPDAPAEEVQRLLILDAPVQELKGKTYSSIAEFVNDLNENNLNRSSDLVVAQLVNDIKSEDAVISDKNIKLDLNGYTITSRTQNTTLDLDNTSLNIVDDKIDLDEYFEGEQLEDLQGKYHTNLDDENNKVNGGVVSLYKDAIGIREGSEFTLGTNGSYREIPSRVAPYIEGVNYGISNDGIFNFYDGKIVGKTAVKGEITHTPVIYNASIESEDNKQIGTLEIIADTEAVIGKKTFLTLEDAIAYANTQVGQDGSQVEIVVVKDLSKVNQITISEDKNILLNLNGYTINCINADYGFVNNGKLEIIDRTGKELDNKYIKVRKDGVVDTGVILEGNYRIETKIRQMDCNNVDIYNTGDGKFRSYLSGDRLMFTHNSTNLNPTNGVRRQEFYEIVNEYKDGVMTSIVNGEQWGTANSSNTTAANTLKLFANSSNAISGNCSMAYFKIYKNDELVLDYVPVKRGTVIEEQTAEQNGFYDNVSKTFHYSSNREFAYNEAKEYKATGTITSKMRSAILNNANGILKITSGNIRQDISSANAIYNYGELEINGGHVYTEYASSNAITNNTTKKFKMNGGLVSSYQSTAIYSLNGALVQINGGEVLAWNGCLTSQVYEINEIEINGGYLEAYQYAINYYRAKANVNNAVVVANNYNVIEVGGYGYLNFKNSYISGGRLLCSALSTNAEGTTFVVDENIGFYKIDMKECISYSAVRFQTGGAERYITIEDSEFKNSGIVSIGGVGTVNLKGNIRSYSKSTSAIYNDGTATINIGVKDEDYKKDLIYARGSWGIYNAGTGIINFYDGTVCGNDGQAIYGIINQLEDGYTLVKENKFEDEEQTVKIQEGYLGDEAVFKIEETGKTYKSFSEMIEAVQAFDANNDTDETTGNNENQNEQGDTNESGNEVNPNETEEERKLRLKREQEQREIENLANLEEVNKHFNIKNNQRIHVTLLRDFDLINSDSSVVDADKRLQLNLNGHILNLTNANGIDNSGDLEVVNEYEHEEGTAKRGYIGTLNSYVFVNNEGATLKLNGIIVSKTGKKPHFVSNKGRFIMDESTIRSISQIVNGSGDTLISNSGAGTLDIRNSTISDEDSRNTAIATSSTNDVNVLNTSLARSINSTSTGNVLVYGCTLPNVTNSGVNNVNVLKTTIKNGDETIFTNSNGEITFYNCAMNGRGINNNAGTINIKGMDTTYYTGYGLRNDGNGTINVYDGSITASYSWSEVPGIANKAAGNVNVYGGSINCTRNAGIKNYSTGKVTIGIKATDEEVENEEIEVSETTPRIKGTTYGVHNVGTGKVDFYDGIIIGPKNCSIYGDINNVEVGYDVIKTNDSPETNLQSAVLKKLPSYRIDTTEYYNLESAVAAVSTNGTIVALRDITVLNTAPDIVVGNDKKFKLDLAGHQISVGQAEYIKNSGDVTVIDSSYKPAVEAHIDDETGEEVPATSEVAGTGIMTSAQGKLFVNKENGKLTIERGTIDSTKTSEAVIYNEGDFKLAGGKIQGNVQGAIGIRNENEGTIEIESGSVYVTVRDTVGILNNSTGLVKMTGGSIYVNGSYRDSPWTYYTGKGIKNNCTKTVKREGEPDETVSFKTNVEILGGTIQADNCAIENTTGDLTVKKANIYETGEQWIITNTTGTVYVERANFESTSNNSNYVGHGFLNSDSGSFTIVGVSLSSLGEAIKNEKSGTFTIKNYEKEESEGQEEQGEQEDETVESNITSRGGTAILNSSTGNIYVQGGKVTGKDVGIRNNSTGKVVLGEKIVSNGEETTEEVKLTPEVMGNTYAIVNSTNGVLDFYDGIIIGPKNKFISGKITEIEEKTELIRESYVRIKENGDPLEEDVSNPKEKIYLSKAPAACIVRNGEVIRNYATINDAIDAAESGDTVRLLRNITSLEQDDKFIVGNDKNIIFDLNGKSMMFSKEHEIENKGTMKIIDSSEDSSAVVYSSIGSMLKNDEGAKLTVAGGNYICDANNIKVINNSGTLEYYDANITSSREKTVGIYNNDPGKVSVTGGKIVITGVSGVAIENYSTNEVDLSDTYIQVTCSVYAGLGNGYNYYGIGIKNNSTGLVSVNEETEFNTSCECIQNNGGIVNITDAELGGGTPYSTRLINNSGTVNLYGDTHVATYVNASSISNKGNMYIYNATVDGGIKSTSGVFEINNGTLNTVDLDSTRGKITGGTMTNVINKKNQLDISGGTMTSVTNSTANGVVNISGGTIKAESNTISNSAGTVTITGGDISSTVGDCIYNTDGGVIVLGYNGDDDVSTDTPEINGATQGINNANGYIDFYDGVVNGASLAIRGKIRYTPDEYEVCYYENNTVATLRIIPTVNRICKIGTKYFRTLQGAIDTASNNDKIDILTEIGLESKVVIPEGLTITIDLQNYIVSYDGSGEAIENNGTLTVIDSLDNSANAERYGRIINENEAGVAIKNNGTLTIGTEESTSTISPVIIAATPITGNEPTVLSGAVRELSVQNGSLTNNEIKVARFNFGGIYTTSKTEITSKNIVKRIYLEAGNVIGELVDKVLSTVPVITGNPELPEYTNDGVDVEIESEVMPNLDMYYAYASIGTVNVEHIDIKTNKVLETETFNGKHGKAYSVHDIEIPMYDLVESEIINEEVVSKLPTNAEGTYDANGDITVKFYYVRKATVNVHYVDIDTNEEVFESEYEDGHEGDKYLVTNRNIDNYMLVTEDDQGNSLLPANAEGTMSVVRDEEGNVIKDDIDVTYYYSNKSEGVTVKYVDAVHDNILYNYHIDGKIGDSYIAESNKAEAADILEKYNLLETMDEMNYLPENATGTMQAGLIEVVYSFVHDYRFEIYFLDENGEELLAPDLRDTFEGANYNLNNDYSEDDLKVSGYKVKVEPASKSGRLIRDDEIADELVNSEYGRYYLRLEYVYEEKTDDDEDPGNNTINNIFSNNTVNEIGNNTVVNNTTNETSNNIVANNTTNEISNNTVANNTTNETSNNTVTNNTTNETSNNTVTNNTTNETNNNTVTNNTINEINNNTVTNNTINEINNNTVANNTTNDIANNTVTNNTTNETSNNTVGNNVINDVNNSTGNELNTVNNTVNNVINNETSDDNNKKDFKVYVHYIDKGTGKRITTDVVVEGRTGEEYLTKEKAINGYELIGKPSNYQGQMIVQVVEGKEVKEIHVTYYYAKKATGILPQTGEDTGRNVLSILGFITCVSLAIVSINQIKKEEQNKD